MCNKLLTQVWSMDESLFPERSITVKYVLVCLADSANESAYCWPSVSAISKKTLIKRSAIFKALSILEKSGFIKRANVINPKTGKQTSNDYWLILPEVTLSATDTVHDMDGRSPRYGRDTVHDVDTNHNIEPSIKSNINTCEVVEIFDYWKLKSNHPNSKLDQKRKSAIERALKNYSLEEIKNAIDGCLSSEYNRQNGFDDIELICRNSSKTDRYIKIYKNPQLGKDNKKGKQRSNFGQFMADSVSDTQDRSKLPWLK